MKFVIESQLSIALLQKFPIKCNRSHSKELFKRFYDTPATIIERKV